MSKNNRDSQISWNFMKAAKKAKKETGLVSNKKPMLLQPVKSYREVR